VKWALLEGCIWVAINYAREWFWRSPQLHCNCISYICLQYQESQHKCIFKPWFSPLSWPHLNQTKHLIEPLTFPPFHSNNTLSCTIMQIKELLTWGVKRTLSKKLRLPNAEKYVYRDEQCPKKNIVALKKEMQTCVKASTSSLKDILILT